MWEPLTEQYQKFHIDPKLLEFADKVESSLKEHFFKIDQIAEYNQLKIIKAMQKNQVSDIHFAATTGYGYNDLGREVMEQVYADIFEAEAALVRPQIMCGTHALKVALFGNLRPNDVLLSVVGKPYDTLESVIGISPSKGSFAEYQIGYRQVDLLENGEFDFAKIEQAIDSHTKVVLIQRSKGYQTRPTLSVEKIGELISFLKQKKRDLICLVDNCYGGATRSVLKRYWVNA